MSIRKFICILVFLSFAPLGFTIEREVWDEYRIALVGQTTADPLYSAVQAGALAAANDLEMELRLEIEIDFKTQRRANVDMQVKALNDCFLAGVDGVILNPIKDPRLNEAVGFLVEQDIPVVVYRNVSGIDQALARVYTDQKRMGEQGMEHLKDAIGPRGKAVAVLSSNSGDLVANQRLAGAKAYADTHNIGLYGVFPTAEEIGAAVNTVDSVTRGDRDGKLYGWLFLGDWPISGGADLPWQPGKMPCVAIGAHPAQLRYLQLDYVDALIANDAYQWGYQSVKVMIDKLHSKKSPESRDITVPAEVVTRGNLDEFLSRWSQWLR
ncbi:sugar ABC transporter substrate-binding protein [Rubellicoccus peritrichatus]|uniref:Substrate-binding domain-containing protein n=1 Tax=Rubellicoccus peritrichatus TaxID=3080537 RepID=A0AAQ3L8H6_9BACT|nr:substrate-binding domain-containing protein [Puniceicoccus sp. CR14]WOO39864.1 substrate-binding domain-containing protein [Puniceicoccus sp. CR14]